MRVKIKRGEKQELRSKYLYYKNNRLSDCFYNKD